MSRRSPLAVFTEGASRFAHNIAVEWQSERVSYRELDERSSRLATRLMGAGARVGDLVVVLLKDSFDVIPALLAVWKAGCVFVPLDPNNPAERLRTMISAVEPHWLLTEVAAAQVVESVAQMFPQQRVVQIDSRDDENFEIDHKLIAERSDALGSDDMCYLYFTSGSTGVPKAIAGRPKSVDHFIH